MSFEATDKPSKSSDSAWSSTTNLRQETLQGASAIHTATHLSSQRTQSLPRRDDEWQVNDEILQTVDNNRLKQLQDVISDIYFKKSPRVSTAATPKELLTEVPKYATTETSSSKDYITETDVRAKFGTTVSVESLTKVNSNIQTTTSSETLTEGNQKYLMATEKSEAEILTEHPSFTTSGLTTEEAETFTVSSATQQPKVEDLATEANLKSRTTASFYSEVVTEGEQKTESSTAKSAISDHVTIADSTDSVLQSDFGVEHSSRTDESGRKEDDEEFTTSDEAIIDSTNPPFRVDLVLPVGDAPAHDDQENKADVVNVGEDNAIHVLQRPAPATDGPSSVNNIGAMPYHPQTTPNAVRNAQKVLRKGQESESTTTSELSDKVVTVVSMTGDEVTTVRSSTEPDVQVVTERTSESTTAETLDEKLSGFFRCTDGTLIDIASHCDKKADCPDYSDEDSCNADEKASLTNEIHRPLFNWNDVASKGSRDDPLISLDNSNAGVMEMEQSRTEAPLTFRCEEGGLVIPISALCDKRIDCPDESDEYSCDGKKYVTEAPTTVETSTKQWTMEPKFENSPTIEILNEENEETEFFRCLDGSAVIPMRSVCDKKWDCEDFSDEDECDSKGKLSGVKSNKTKPGIPWANPKTPAHLPNREQNMVVQEISDEKGALPEFWQCENGNYIFISSVCDKKDDCGDFSDEDDCKGNRKVPVTEAPDVNKIVTTMSPLSNLSESGTLATTTYMSTTVQSTAASLTLFQVDDVKSWSQGVTPSMDIVEENYPVAMFQCDNGQQVEAVKVCDRNVDCDDGSDEDDCYDWMEEPGTKLRFAREAGSGTGPTPVVCGDGYFQCIDCTCIPLNLTCNGINNCAEGEDEDTASICSDSCELVITPESRLRLVSMVPQARYQNGTILTLGCIGGFTLVGDPDVTCIESEFSAPPTCYQNCLIDSRPQLICSSNDVLHGASPDCRCDAGYNLEIAMADITCRNSIFDPQHPQCEETNECLLNVSPCSGNAECFNMPLGSFLCICNPGYTGNGTYCEDVNECATGSNTCDEDSTCTNTQGSYTCACNSGFEGDGMTCIEQIYYNYGLAAGDSEMTSTAGFSFASGYSVSGAIARMQYIPIGDQLFNYIFLTNSGGIAFSNEEDTDLSQFIHPSPFTDNANNSSMSAVYVYGIEARTDEADSGVYYQIYESTATDESTVQLLANVSTQVNSAASFSDYVAKWAMVITWVNLRRFLTAADSVETNTFQAVLTTDGANTYILQLYQENSLLWDAGQLAVDEIPVIGYRTPSSFYDLMSSDNSYTRSMMFRPDALTGNIEASGMAQLGQFVFRLDTNPAGYINPAEFCQNWYDTSSTVSSNLDCPCSFAQADRDNRYRECIAYTPDTQYPSIDSYPSTGLLCRQRSRRSRNGLRCTYNQDGTLLIGYVTMWQGSNVQETVAPPSVSIFSNPYQSWVENDVLPRHFCCSQLPNVNYCNLYQERRPSLDCSNYRAPWQGWGAGDPHITTPDGANYTFNGLGEYWLTRIDSTGFKLQGRTERTFDDNGNLADTGTVFTSVVAEQDATRVQFDLNAVRTQLSILINRTEATIVDIQAGQYESSDPSFDLRYSGNRYQALFTDSTGREMSFSIGVSQSMIDLSIQVPAEYVDGRTRGLYGVVDGDSTNDFTSPDGTVLTNPNDAAIFQYGQSWKIESSASLFTYQSPNTYDTYNVNSFQPMTITTLMASASQATLNAVLSSCSGDNTCIFDALATNDITVGTNTMMIGMDNMQQVVELESYPPILGNLTEMNPSGDYPAINVDGVVNVIVNRTYTFVITATDQNNDAITYSLTGNVPSSASIDSSSGTITWTPANTDSAVIEIRATDGTGLYGALQLLIVVCGCQNEGICNFNDIMAGDDLNNNKFAVAQCMCQANGYSGPFCENDKDSCEFVNCYPGVTCIDLPPPSETPTCADCPPSLTGDGFQCADLDECMSDATNDCGTQAKCENNVGSYSCSCNTGYSLQPNQRDCIDVDECESGIDACDENSACVNNNGSYICICNDGYQLQSDNRTCSDIDECNGMPCGLHADCGNVIGSYTCSCQSGYIGDGRDNCTDYDECFNPNDNDCDELAICDNKDGYYTCTCQLGYEDKNSTSNPGQNCTDIDECLAGQDSCSQYANCINIEGSFMCECRQGYNGDGNTCVDNDECLDPSDNDCDANAACSNIIGSFSCACNAGFTGNGTYCQDINECNSSPSVCHGNATCTNTEGTYRCSCNGGYTGDGVTCNDINECDEQIDNCTQVCNNNDGSYTCSCNQGFVLNEEDQVTCDVAVAMACNVDLDHCTGGGTCMNSTGAINFTCTCPRGFYSFNGTHCEDINECSDNSSNNCDSTVGVCSNKEGGYTCSCMDGYMLAVDERDCRDINECETGNNNCSVDAVCNNWPGSFNCTCNAGYVGDGTNCTDIDECENSSICGENTDCINTAGSYMCQCSSGYLAGGPNLTCQDMDECVSMPCHANANCSNTIGSYVCTCLKGFTGNGSSCDDINECNDTSLCTNSRCEDLVGSYTCICNDGYRGDGTDDCVDIDECLDNPESCHLRATCKNTNASYTCTCNAGYEGNGTHCTNINECERGMIDCDVNSMCSDTDGSYTCSCNQGYFDITGGRASVGECQDVNECDLQVDMCDENSMCQNNAGNYTCTCNDGYMAVDRLSCTDILECSQNPNPCDTGAFEICKELDGSYECICQPSTYRVNGVCSMTTTLFLTTRFVDIQGLIVEFHFDTINNEADRQGLANDTMALLMNSATFSNVLDVSIQSLTILDGGMVAEVIFRVDIPFTNTTTENDLAMAFVAGLTGTRKDILSPDNRVYAKSLIDVDLNECANMTICPDLSVCINTVGSYSCKCEQGYTFRDSTNQTCVDLDECEANVCSEYSNCTNSIGSFTCVCNDGFTGDGIICDDIDECQTGEANCGNNTDCTNIPGSYECSCAIGYYGTPPSCLDIDECSADHTNNCTQNCTNNPGSYDCSCTTGYVLDGDGITCNDINECETANDCGANSMCNNTVGSYICTCDDGYSGSPPGSLCQDINECTDQTDQCSQNCINEDGSYSCSCNSGFDLDSDGFTCNVAPGMDCDPALDPCTGGGMCINASSPINCTCPRGFDNFNVNHCQDTDECTDMTDNCDSSLGACTNTPGSYNCSCIDGYMLEADQRTCTDIDECLEMTDNCDDSGGVCTNTPGNFSCSCLDGYSLGSDQRTCTDINECLIDNDCGANSMCNNTEGSYICTCDTGYSGIPPASPCLDINECETANDCGANSMCNNTVGSYICTCDDGYSGSPPGSLCQDIDECDGSNPCTLANEECSNTLGSYQCVCAAGFVRTSNYCLTNATISGSLTINLVDNQVKAYTDSLADPTSQEYMNLTYTVCSALLSEVNRMVNTSTPYPMATCKVTSFAPGSSLDETVVNFILTVYGENTEAVTNITTEIMTNGFSDSPRVWTGGDGITIQLLSLFFDDTEECALPTSCTGVNEFCVELDPGFVCNCTETTLRFMGMCLYKATLMGSFRYNRVNGVPVTFRNSLGDSSTEDYTNETIIACGVFTDQITAWVNVSVAYEYIDCRITGFSPGSIIVDFILDIYGTSMMEAMMRAQIASDNGFQGIPSNWTGASDVIYVEELLFGQCNSSTPVCGNGGTCLYNASANMPYCRCPPGYSGDVCQNSVCDGYTCLNGGTCLVDTIGDPYCQCPSEYTGTLCENPVACVELDCQNNSTCEVDDSGIASCNCLDGYEGETCQLESTPGLSTGVIVGIVLGVVGFVLLVVVLCFCCLILFAARRRRQRKRELLEGADNWGYGGRRYAPAVAAPSATSGPSRAVVRNDPVEFSSESSDNFYYYQNTRGRPYGAAAGSAPSARPIYTVDDDDDDDTIDSRFSGIIRNMWNMHADQRPEAAIDPRELPSASNFMAGGIPRASVQPRHLYPEYNNAGFERPYVADGTESYQYSEETEDFRPYRGRNRDKSRSAMEAYNYF
ncbi:uncharacterized protein LOC129254474 [Lytechinus pictus]|uniref:uncharacterized protein LOC129254474 n=1 Tax=Lytechinus pictus TaxID=7653 RepID=UPI0030BA0B91